MESEEIKNLKDAIIELYLAIKIRSSEEVRYFLKGLRQTLMLVAG